MKCKNCGAELMDGIKFCGNCGVAVELPEVAPVIENEVKDEPKADTEVTIETIEEPKTTETFATVSEIKEEAVPEIEVTPAVATEADALASIPEEYKPIGMWGYFGLNILFSIPLIGLIFILIFSFGGTKNKNLCNFARSFFCWMVISVVLLVALAIFIGVKLGF